MKKRLLVVGMLLFFLVLPFGSMAFGYSQVVSFGDSLSDNGDADGYGFGIASNGPVWVDYLAGSLNTGLLDMAYGGAQSNFHPASGTEEFGFNWQIDTYLALNGGVADEDALYTLWIGGNDLLNGGSVEETVDYIELGIEKLVGAGAENVLVMNMPNLGATPLMNGQNLYMNEDGEDGPFVDNQLGGEFLSEYFNMQLAIALSVFGDDAFNLFQVDIFGLMNQFIVEGTFDNSTNMLAYAGVTDDTYLFWDPIHPTTFAHSLIAEAAYAEVAPVPEPAALFLLSTGLIGLISFRRKIKQ